MTKPKPATVTVEGYKCRRNRDGTYSVINPKGRRIAHYEPDPALLALALTGALIQRDRAQAKAATEKP